MRPPRHQPRRPLSSAASATSATSPDQSRLVQTAPFCARLRSGRGSGCMPGRGHLGRVACPLNRDDRRATAALGDGCPTRSNLTARSVEEQLVGRSPEYRRGNPTENPVGKTEVVLQLAGPAGGRQKHSVVVSKTRGLPVPHPIPSSLFQLVCRLPISSSTGQSCLLSVRPVSVAPDFGLRFQVERAGCGSYPEPAGHNSGMALPIGEGPERRKPNELGRRIQQLMRSRVAVGRSPGEVAATQVVPRSYRS